jgi:hypothetical protein
MWFTYVHCWATDVFSIDPTRVYISSPVENPGGYKYGDLALQVRGVSNLRQ